MSFVVIPNCTTAGHEFLQLHVSSDVFVEDLFLPAALDMLGIILEEGRQKREYRYCQTMLFHGKFMQCQKRFYSSFINAFVTGNVYAIQLDDCMDVAGLVHVRYTFTKKLSKRTCCSRQNTLVTTLVGQMC